MCEGVSKHIVFKKQQHCFPKKNPLFFPKKHCFPTCALFYPIVLKRKNITGCHPLIENIIITIIIIYHSYYINMLLVLYMPNDK